MKKLSTGAAAELLGVNPRSLLRYVEKKLISCEVTPGGHRRFKLKEVKRLKKAMRK